MGPLSYRTLVVSLAASQRRVDRLALYGLIAIGLFSVVSCQLNKATESSPVETIKQVDNLTVLLQHVDEDIESFRLSSPNNNNALEKLAKASKSNPHDDRLSQYRDKVAHRYLYLTEAAIIRKKWDKAERYLKHAQNINSGLGDIELLKQSLIAAKAEHIRQETEQIKADALQKELQATPLLAITKQRKSQAPKRTLNPTKEQTVKLNQKQINARSTFVSLSLDNASQEIINKNATVTIFTQSVRDYRWLNALLKTSIYLIDSDFEVLSESHVDKSSDPKMVIKPRS